MMKWLRSQESSPVSQQVEIVTDPVDYPSGLVVEAENASYLIVGRSKFRLFSERVVESWGFDWQCPGTEHSLSKMKKGGVLGFRNGTLIRNFADSRTYLISENKRRHIKNPDVFAKYGLDENRVLVVSQDETDLHDEGEVLL